MKLVMLLRKESGVRRVVWLSAEIDGVIEDARERLGMTRSGFIRYSVLRLLEDLSLLTGRVKASKMGG